MIEDPGNINDNSINHFLEKECMPFCKLYGRESENMIACSICFTKHHYECVGIHNKNEITILWNCPLCRKIPGTVREISTRTSRLESIIDEQTMMITELLRIVRKLDNDDEHSKLFNLDKINHKQITSNKDVPDLLIGSSILKEFASKEKSFKLSQKVVLKLMKLPLH